MSRRPSLFVLPSLEVLVVVLVVLVGGPTGCDLRRPVPSGPIPASWPYPANALIATARHGMVVSDSALASHVGSEVLAAGGNAVDAAVATAFVLAVTLPEAGNLGGGGFAVVRSAAKESYGLDFREAAPLAASREMFAGRAADALAGPRASATPGTVAGLWALHQRLGRRPWAALVEPALQLARDGFAVDERMASGILEAKARLAASPASARRFLPGGSPPPVGSIFRQPELAATLGRIADRGAAGFYYGETASMLAAAMRSGGGLLTEADLASYQARWRTPLEVPYRGVRLVGMPPPSSGGMVVGEIARLVAGWDVGAMGWHSADHLTLVAEAEQRAFADRGALLGDPDFAPVAWNPLDEELIATRRGTIDPFRATPSSDVRPTAREGHDTTHLGVVDGDGMAVALTTTLNELYGSGVTVAGLGILMNDEMEDFVPGVEGASEPNAIEPGKRPLSSMAPTLVLDGNGDVIVVTGARGGGRILSATFQVISNVVDFGMGVGAAVSAPRIHHQHEPDTLFVEPDGLTAETGAELERRGFHVEHLRVIGAAPTLVRGREGWTGFADPRRGGDAEGE